MPRTDRASLLIHAGADRVFAALIDRDAMLEWLPPKGMTGRFESFDLREGGSFRMVLTYEDPSGAPGKTSADSDATDVRIAELLPGQRIRQEVDFASDDPRFQGTMQMTWSLLPVDEHSTEVTVEATNVPDGVSARDHAEGLTSSLSNLAAYLEPAARS